MKRITLIAVLFTVLAFGVWAEDAAAATSAPAPSMGNNLTLQTGVTYSVLGLPSTNVEVGYDMQVNPTLLLSVNLGTLTRQNKNTAFNGTTATGGESNFILAGLQLKKLFGSFYVGGGFDYRTFTNGYFSTSPSAYQSLAKSDVSDALDANICLGYYAKIANNLYLTPGLTVGYSLPTSTSFTFAASDISIGVNVGIAFNMSAQ
jgi:hypothetical protein